VGGTRAPAATILACLALLAVPTVSVAAERTGASGSADRASEPLAPGAGYGQPQGEPRVRALQRRLRALGLRPGPVDGLYGARTAAAVERLQRDSGLTVDGIVGPQTRRVLTAEALPLVPGAGYGQPGGSRQVREVQRKLRALGQRPGPVDGIYGPRTRAAIQRFQRTADRPATGVLTSAVALALARTDRGQPRAAPPVDRAGRDRRPAGGPARTADVKTRSPQQTEVRTATADDGGPTSLLPWAAAALALLVVGGLVAAWARRRRSSPEAHAVPAVPATPKPRPTNGQAQAPAVPATPKPRPTNGEAQAAREAARPSPADIALGYLTVREPGGDYGREMREQMAAIEAACRDHGLQLTEVVRESVEAGAERPGMQHAMDRLAAGEASCMVVAELGRLSHSAPEVGTIVESLRRHEKRLVTASEGLDTSTQSGSEAADELVSLSAAADRRPGPRAGNGKERRWTSPVERGSHRTSPAEYDVPALKQRIRAMRASGMTLQAIADRLNAENVPTIRGGVKWRPSSVQAAAGYRRSPAGASTRADPGAGKGNRPSGTRRGSSKRGSGRRGGGRR
jgi:peptidoglycan hydrolase-like protein with peptidoglycan-binding domain/DNA invertase Pin-like site-specific DNA recombinase